MIYKILNSVHLLAGHDAPPPRRVFHSAAGSGRAHLLGAEQPAKVFRAHAQVRTGNFAASSLCDLIKWKINGIELEIPVTHN